MRPWAGPARDGRCDDGLSRPFSDSTRSARQIVAQTLAAAEGWAEIRPGHWSLAGRVTTALRTQRLLRPRPGGDA